MKIAEVLKNSNYKLSQFNEEDVRDLEENITLKKTAKGTVPYVQCRIREKQIRLTPEEVIRQLYIKILTDRYQYPADRIQLEYPVHFGREVKRADIVVFDKDKPSSVFMIVEVKSPNKYNAVPEFLDEYELDSHGHLFVDHNLFNHDGLTGDGIAEAFAEFAKKESLPFF